ncbi:MAG: hypothetical protein ABID63_10095 [Pseudomonadota bacterium]
MTQTKGSKIALVVAGVLVIAGVAIAVSMSQSDDPTPAMPGATSDPASPMAPAPGDTGTGTAPVTPAPQPGMGDNPAADPSAPPPPPAMGDEAPESGDTPQDLMPDSGGENQPTEGEAPRTE